MSSVISYVEFLSEAFLTPANPVTPSNYNGTIVDIPFASGNNYFKSLLNGGDTFPSAQPYIIKKIKFDIVGLPGARLFQDLSVVPPGNSQPNVFFIQSIDNLGVESVLSSFITSFGEWFDVNNYANVRETPARLKLMPSDPISTNFSLLMDYRNLQDAYKGINVKLLCSLELESTRTFI